MHLRESPRELLPGSPVCAPPVAVMTESVISLIRSLHMVPAWSGAISKHMCNQLEMLHAWTEEMQHMIGSSLLVSQHNHENKVSEKTEELQANSLQEENKSKSWSIL